MSTPSRYPVPAAEFRQTEVISRSRFITTVAPAPSVGDAMDFINRMKAEFPDATHNCWAYLVGPPGSSARIGMSDDGEPHGTAGKPMLGMLLHGGIGDTAAVVTRYFGGTKLGTGGLVRAYGGCVQRALQAMTRSERVERVNLVVRMAYPDLEAVRGLAAEYEAIILDQSFGADVALNIMAPVEGQERLVAAILDGTRGRAIITDADGAPAA